MLSLTTKFNYELRRRLDLSRLGFPKDKDYRGYVKLGALGPVKWNQMKSISQMKSWRQNMTPLPLIQGRTTFVRKLELLY